MKFDYNKIIIDPKELVVGNRYLVAEYYPDLIDNVKNINKTAIYAINNTQGYACDDSGCCWNFWYPYEEQKKKYVPYKNSKSEWIGKAVRFKGTELVELITLVDSTDDSDYPIYINGVSKSLDDFFDGFEWLDGTPCGEVI